MDILIFIGALIYAVQGNPKSVCEMVNGTPFGKCAATESNCRKGYECLDGVCCRVKERLCPQNQPSHGLCDQTGQCPNVGHSCYTTDQGQRVCCNKTPLKSDIPGGLCSAKGYTVNPLLGCYRIASFDLPVAYNEGKQACANDGGRLLLVDSAEEAVELGAELIRVLYGGTLTTVTAIIQGSRSPGSSQWVTDDGSPLPYSSSTFWGLPRKDATGLLYIFYHDEVMYAATSPQEKFTHFVCEINFK